MSADLSTLVGAYIDAKIALVGYRSRTFPRGSVVAVKCSRFTGQAIVAIADGCPVDEVPCRLENGNTWRYPITALQPLTGKRQWERWIRRAKLPNPSMLLTASPRYQRKLP